MSIRKKTLLGLLLIFLSFIVGCSKENTRDSSSQKLTKSDVVGSYYFQGYSGPLKRELEISFEVDQTGSAQEMSYGSDGNFLSTHAYSFTWSISGNKVLLEGVSGRADNEGGVGLNVSWTAVFDYLYGMLVPGNPFIAGYAEHAVFSMIGNEIEDYVDCTATLDKSSGRYTIVINSRLDGIWKDIFYKYGVSWDWEDYQWGTQKGNQVRFECESEMALFYNIVADINKKEKEESLTQNEEILRDNSLDVINQYIKDFQSGQVSFRVGVNASFAYRGEIFDTTFDINPQFYVSENGNNSNGDNGNNNQLLPDASGDGSLSSPFNIAGAINAVKLNGDKETSAQYYVKGRISAIKYPFDAEYGTAVFDITDDGLPNEKFLKCFSIYFLENKSWEQGFPQISKGDYVTVYGNLGKWNDSYYETVEHKAYIHSLNGSTTFTLL